MNEQEAREIINHIATSSIKLAFLRHNIRNDFAEFISDDDIQEIIDDVVNCLTGDDTGCLDPSELTHENCELLWLLKDRKMIKQFQGPYRFLSNFYQCEVVLDNITYPSVEHAYQASKTLDRVERSRILMCSTPGDAKRRGRKVKIRENWDQIRLEVMEGLLRQKFSQEPFTTLLIKTEDRELVEGNYWGDTFWGRCDGEGENHLGKLIMKIRDEIRTKISDKIDENITF